MTAIEQLIHFLNDAAVSPANAFSSFAHAVATLPQVPTQEAGIIAAAEASIARHIVRQMPDACAAGQIALRDVLCALVKAIEAEIEARDGLAVPYHQKD